MLKNNKSSQKNFNQSVSKSFKIMLIIIIKLKIDKIPKIIIENSKNKN
jgi:hypothetical protein